MFPSILELERVDDNRFVAPSSPDKGERVFGGQFMAQCLYAAQCTIEDGRPANSFHSYFLRPGNVEQRIDIIVDVVRDGRTFSSRQAIAYQNRKELYRMIASFQVSDQSPEYTAVPMPDVPPPESIVMTYDDFHLQQTGETAWAGSNRPMDIRYINPPGQRGEAVTEAQLMWMKIRDPIASTATAHQAGLAYLSDSSLVDHVMLPHGLRWQDEDFAGASLDHSMWFHRHGRADEWVLFTQSVETTGSGRGLAIGRFFDQQGTLLATCTQEGLMRWS